MGVYNKFTNWVENQLALVERDVQANFDVVAMVGVLGICIGIVWLQLLKRLTSFMVHLTMMLVVEHQTILCLMDLRSEVVQIEMQPTPSTSMLRGQHRHSQTCMEHHPTQDN